LGALVALLNSTLEDDRFPGYEFHHKGGCDHPNDEVEGHNRIGCLREYYGGGIRVTFSFQAFGDFPNQVFTSLVSSSQQPDLVVVNTGPWFYYGNATASDERFRVAVQRMLYWLHSNTTAPIVWLSTPVCLPFKESFGGSSSNAIARSEVLNFAKSNGQAFFLNRHSSTAPVYDVGRCEGFHAWRDVVVLHVRMLVWLVCTQT